MTMERETWPGDSDEEGPVDGQAEDAGKSWYFELPGGAWERQEAKNRDLRNSVLQNIEGESRRRTFPGTEPDPALARKGLFGRRKKQYDAPSARESAGGTYRLSRGGVDADAWKQSTTDSRDDKWTTEPVVRELPLAGRRADERQGRGRPSQHGDDEGSREPPLVPQRRQQADSEERPAGGRWTDAFGAAASDQAPGEAVHESHSTGSRWGDSFGTVNDGRPRQRRILPGAVARTPADEENGDAREEAAPRVRAVQDDEPVQLRRQGHEPDDESADAVGEKPPSRWDEMFSAPVEDGSVVEGLRKWAGKTEADPVADSGANERPGARWEEKFGLAGEADEREATSSGQVDSADTGAEDYRVKAAAEERWPVEHKNEGAEGVGPDERPHSLWEEKFGVPAEDRRDGPRRLKDDDRADERPRWRWEEKFGVPAEDPGPEPPRRQDEGRHPAGLVKPDNWQAPAWSEQFEEPDIGEDLNLFRVAEESPRAEEPRREGGKGFGFGRIFGRRKSQPREPEYRPGPAGAWLPPEEDGPGQTEAPDWGSASGSVPTSWSWPSNDESDGGVEGHFGGRLEGRSKDLFDEGDDYLLERQAGQRPGRSQPEDRDRRSADGFDAPQEERTFTVPDRPVEESRPSQAMTERTEAPQREARMELPAENWTAPDERPLGPGVLDVPPRVDVEEPLWDPEPYEPEERARPHRAEESRREPAEPMPGEYDAAAEQEAPDDDDPWARFMADRGLSTPRRTEPRSEPTDSDEITRQRREAMWSE